MHSREEELQIHVVIFFLQLSARLLRATILRNLPFEFAVMATYLMVDEVVDRVTEVDYELSSGEESKYEGDGIASYLPGSLDGPMDFFRAF